MFSKIYKSKAEKIVLKNKYFEILRDLLRIASSVCHGNATIGVRIEVHLYEFSLCDSNGQPFVIFVPEDEGCLKLKPKRRVGDYVL